MRKFLFFFISIVTGCSESHIDKNDLDPKKYSTEYKPTDKINTLLFSDNFAGHKPDWQATGWNYSTKGYTSGKTGSSNLLWLNRVYNINKRSLSFDITLNKVDTNLYLIAARDKNFGGEGASGFAIDFKSKKLKVFNTKTQFANSEITSDGLDLNSIIGEQDIKLNIEADKRYTVTLAYYETIHTLSIKDNSTGKTESLSFDGWQAGRQQMYYSFFCKNGSVTISDVNIKAISDIDVLFIGDSITEGVMVENKSKRWWKLLEPKINGVVAVSAAGGVEIQNIIDKFYTEILPLKPKESYITIGINGGATASQYKKVYDLFVNNGLKVYFNFLPTTSVYESRQIECNNAIRSVIPSANWGFNFDLSTSVNNDGHTCDASLFYDGLHPKENGCEQMAKRILIKKSQQLVPG